MTPAQIGRLVHVPRLVSQDLQHRARAAEVRSSLKELAHVLKKASVRLDGWANPKGPGYGKEALQRLVEARNQAQAPDPGDGTWPEIIDVRVLVRLAAAVAVAADT